MLPVHGPADIPSAGCSENQELDQLDRKLGGAEVTAVSARRADMGNIFAAHFRYERANGAARRFISKSTAVTISRRDIVAFLQRRRDPLPPGQIERCAEEAIERWLRSRANRYRAAP
jgi:hypothetical protein